MSDITVYMSPLEPPMISSDAGTGISIDDNTVTINMVPVDRPGGQIFAKILRDDKNYIEALWPEGYEIKWERTYVDFENGKTSPQIGITIEIAQPHNADLDIKPWWTNSIIYSRNPARISFHIPFVVDFSHVERVLGKIPESGDKEDYWQYKYFDSEIFNEDQPIVRPGEYLVVVFYCTVNGKNFISKMVQVKYETPLFTGGWITSKTGEGTNVLYTVNVFGQDFSGIRPTDFFDYEVGKWVYLMKDVNLAMNPDFNNKQMYSSDDIEIGSGYRVVPFNFKGPMNTECAIPWQDSIDIDSATQFERVFDMVRYESTISNINYENDTATITTGDGNTKDNIPIFYYCSSTEVDLVGGSKAFKDGDSVVVEVPSNDWDDAKIIGFPDEVKPCEIIIVLKPTFNGNFAVNGKQIIRFVYTFEDNEIIKYTQITGDLSSNIEYKTVEGCSYLLSFDSVEEFTAFKDTAVFYVCSLPKSGYYKDDRVTFYHWYETVDPETSVLFGNNYDDHIVINAQIGVGDGTTEPTINDFSMDDPDIPWGFSTLLLSGYNCGFYLSTKNESGSIISAYFDSFGFSGFRSSSNLIQGQLNVETGKWDIPLIFKQPVLSGEPIMLKFQARNYCDYCRYFDSVRRFFKRVDYIEADETLDVEDVETITLEDGKEVTAYHLSFSNLKIIEMVPNEMAEANETYGAYGTDDLIDDYENIRESWIEKQASRVDISASYGNFSSWNYDYTRMKEIVQDVDYATVFRGILSDEYGQNPIHENYVYSFYSWISSYFTTNISSDPDCYVSCDTVNPCSTGPDGSSCPTEEEWIEENGCPCMLNRYNLRSWAFNMIDTPAEAF